MNNEKLQLFSSLVLTWRLVRVSSVLGQFLINIFILHNLTKYTLWDSVTALDLTIHCIFVMYMILPRLDYSLLVFEFIKPGKRPVSLFGHVCRYPFEMRSSLLLSLTALKTWVVAADARQEGCLKRHQVYFIPSLVQIPIEIKALLVQSHATLLRDFGISLSYRLF